MIEKMISELKPFLPLKITGSSWNGICLNIYGLNWGFFTKGSWRVTDSIRMLFGCYDKEAKAEVSHFSEVEIVDIIIQEGILKIDPVFVLSNGKKIEIFSTEITEPWSFSMESIGCYIATPNTPHLFEAGIMD